LGGWYKVDRSFPIISYDGLVYSLIFNFTDKFIVGLTYE